MEIFTSFTSFRALNKNDFVFSYKELGEKYSAWIEEQIRRMTIYEKSPAETAFENKIKNFRWCYFPQVYFAFGNFGEKAKGYFLDYYVPTLRIAFEIDGIERHYSNEKMMNDWYRDMEFWRIGIKTIRFTAHEVNQKDFRENIFTPRVKAFLAQGNNYDPDKLYYDIARQNRFLGEETNNQKMLRLAINALKDTPPHSKLIIQSPHTYIMRVLSHGSGYCEKNLNRALLEEYYRTRDDRHIWVFLQYTGNRENLNPNAKRIYKMYDHSIKTHIGDEKVRKVRINISHKKIPKGGDKNLTIPPRPEYLQDGLPF